MFMIRLYVCLAFLFAQKLNGQVSKPTKNQLLRIFKSSIQKSSRNKVEVGRNHWVSCNHDSSFFKMDTVYFHNYDTHTNQSQECCDFISWTFYKPTAFVQTDLQLCKEPPTSKFVGEEDFYTIEVNDGENQTIIKVFSKKQLIEKFSVVAFNKVTLAQKSHTSNRLILVRQH